MGKIPMQRETYTIIVFSPVQGFIEKSRKLRDLFGSSFLLSYLAKSLCKLAKDENLDVIAPATPKLTQGVPNQIIIKGDLSKDKAHQHFQDSWSRVVDECKQVLKRKLSLEDDHWGRAWNNWKSHCWEFFWAQSHESIFDARQRMKEVKRARAWTGVNWVGESSTLSGADAIAWPGMLDRVHPKPHKGKYSAQAIKTEIDAFYQSMADQWDDAFFDSDERLNIPEIVKRLITHSEVADRLNLKAEDYPDIDLTRSFKDLNRHEKDNWTGWFQGDGDNVGDFLRSRVNWKAPNSAQLEEAELRSFSRAMIDWGENFKLGVSATRLGRIVYAGGDDFLGVLYPTDPAQPITLKSCLEQWLYSFPTEWAKHQQPITVSVGFVWAAPRVPQREVLQHCKKAETSAKKQGKDRVALRIAFNGGNYLEWTCPWRFLQPILSSYRDREGNQAEPNWGHLNEDVQVLQARHAFDGQSSNIAKELFQIYFPDCPVAESILNSKYWFNPKQKKFDLAEPYQSGILGNKDADVNPEQAFNEWFINLAQIGIHLFKKSPVPVSISQ